MSCVILAKLPDLWVLPLLNYVISVTLPDFSVHNIKMCVILDKLPDLSVLPLLSSLISGKLPELSVGFPVHQQLLELAQTPLHRVDDDIQLTYPLSSTWNTAIKISAIWVFSKESVFHIRWPECWNFQWMFRTDVFKDGLVSSPWTQETVKSLPQYPSSKASFLLCSAFFTVQLSHPYITTRKTTGLTRGTFVSKVMSMLFHILCRLVRAFLPGKVKSVF